MSNERGNQHQGKRSCTFVLVLSMLIILTVILLMLPGFAILSLTIGSDEAFSSIGVHIEFKRLKLLLRNDGQRLREKGEQWTEILSWEPRAFVYHNFLSKEECEYLINLARPHMVKSTVIDRISGKSMVDTRFRTSSVTFLRRGQDEVIGDIEKRIADFTFIPVEHGEGLQVLHYEVGQKYALHYDFFFDEYNTKNGGQRIATLLMYLSDVEEGDETVFPAANGNFRSMPNGNMPECCKRGLALKPKMGDALLFWSIHPNATLDQSSLHGGCPVIKGNKWSATMWIRDGEYKI